MLPEDDVFDRRFARRLLDKYPEQFSEGSHSAERGRDDVADSFDPGPEQSGQQQSPVGYRIGAEIGRGGMGAVLEVWDKVLERDLAMKVVLEKPESPRHRRALGRFLREARITGQLDHPGVVPVHDLGVRPDGTAYFTMLRVRGRGLHEIFARALSDDESWSQNRVLGVLLKVCDTVAYAHSKGIVHRDLKPMNVMVGEFGEVYVMDWGLAKVVGDALPRDWTEAEADDGTLLDVTLEGTVLGTPSYMPPEQARGEEVTPAADIYAIGAMLYTLLCGEQPYQEVPRSEVLAAIVDRPPRSLRELAPEVPRRLARICERALEREVADRYDDMVAMAAALRSFLEAEQKALDEADRAQETSRFLIGLFELSDPELGDGETVTAREILDRGAQRLTEGFQQQPKARSTLLETMAAIYRNLGLHQRSRELLLEALEFRKSERAIDSPDLARVLQMLGTTYLALGDYAEARSSYRASLEIWERNDGAWPLEVASVLSDMAVAHRELGELSEAETLCRDALARRTAGLGRNHEMVAVTLNNLAALLAQRGRLEEAEEFYREALEIRRDLLGPNHLEVALTLNNLAGVFRLRGALAEAEPLYRESLAIRQERLPRNHPKIASSLNGLATLLSAQSKYEAAEPLIKRALEIGRRRLGDDHPSVGTYLDNLSMVLAACDRFDEAERYSRESLEIRRRRLGPTHLETARGLTNLGRILARGGKLDEALELLREAVDRFRDADDAGVLLSTAAFGLGQTLFEAGFIDEARRQLEYALLVTKETFGEEHVKVTEIRELLDEVAKRGEQPLDRENEEKENEEKP